MGLSAMIGAIDEVRTLPLTPLKGNSKSEFVVFVNKIYYWQATVNHNDKNNWFLRQMSCK